MSSRYIMLKTLPNNMVSSDCPVMIVAGGLLKDNTKERILIQLKLENIGQKTIKAIKVWFKTFDTTENIVDERVEHQYLELKIEPYGIYTDKNGVLLNSPIIRDFSIAITDVVFEDGTMWSGEAVSWEVFPEPQNLDDALGSEIAGQYKNVVGEKAVYLPIKSGCIWRCTCGEINNISESNCRACNVNLAFQFDNLKADILSRNYSEFCKKAEAEKLERERKEAEEREAEEKRKAEEERKAEEARKMEEARAKKNKKLAMIITPIVAVALVFVIVLTTVIIPNGKYNDAVALMEAGKYQEAKNAFAELVGYNDSLYKLTECDNIIGKNSISSGAYFSLGVKSDGTVVATDGMSGTDGWSDISAVSAGGFHTVGLKSDGTVVATGDNYFGQCSVDEWTDIVAVAAGKFHTLGLKSDGTVVATNFIGGENYKHNGQCNVSDWKDIVSISAGEYYSVGLNSKGHVIIAGSCKNGQGEATNWKDIIAISASEEHIVGLKADGTVVAAGPTQQCDVSEWTDIVAISAGENNTIGLKSDGTVVAVGDNEYGQCDIEEWTDIVAVSAGAYHTIGLKSDGTVVSVGRNSNFQCDAYEWSNIKTPGSQTAGNADSTSIDIEKLKSAEVGDFVVFGSYERDNDISNGKEKIHWIVLEKQENKILVLSKYAIESMPYNTTAKDVTWETCTLRKWLNKDFWNTAFSEEEKAMIPTVTVSADKNPKYSTNPGNATQDKVFLLSLNEVNRYLTPQDNVDCERTIYADEKSELIGCFWWLRTPGKAQDYAVSNINSYGSEVNRDGYTVRPAMWIEIE